MSLTRCLQDRPRPKGILVVKLSAIGDVVQSLPALYALKQQWPDATIDWLVEDKAQQVLEGHPDIDRLIVFKRCEKNLWSLLCQLRETSYDWAIDLQGTYKSAGFMRMARAQWKIGYDQNREPCQFLYNAHAKLKTQDQLPVVRNLDILKQLGAEVNSVQYHFPLGQEDFDCVARIVQVHQVGAAYAVLSAVTSWLTKCWGREKFRQFLQKLPEHYRGTIFVVGGAQDKEVHAKLCDGLDHVVDLTGTLNLKQSAALMQDADFMVSGDTGPLHLAVAVGCPVFGIYGSTNPKRTGPFQEEACVVQGKLDCQPCYKNECPLGHHRCMEDLSVDYVLEQFIDFWKQRREL